MSSLRGRVEDAGRSVTKESQMESASWFESSDRGSGDGRPNMASSKYLKGAVWL